MKISNKTTVGDRAGRDIYMSGSHKTSRSTRIRVMAISMIGINSERVC